MHTEIFTTLLVFLTSSNREIVKSILGFVKLAIHTLPADLIRPHLKDLVPALLGWSHDHKNHFKAKVRHIFERMLRRFGWDEVYGCASESEDAAKVLVNIKKRKERAKRKKVNARNGDEDEEEEVGSFCCANIESYLIFLQRRPPTNQPRAMHSRTSSTGVKVNWMTVTTSNCTSSSSSSGVLRHQNRKVLPPLEQVHVYGLTMMNLWISSRVLLLV